MAKETKCLNVLYYGRLISTYFSGGKTNEDDVSMSFTTDVSFLLSMISFSKSTVRCLNVLYYGRLISTNKKYGKIYH